MTPRLFAAPIITPALLLAACSQSNAPSEQLGEAADELVEAMADEVTALEEAAETAEALEPAEIVYASQFEPRNDCGEMEGAEHFIAALNAAIAMRDTDLLVALAAEDVKLDFGGRDGVEFLREDLDNEDWDLWNALAETAALGCAANSQSGLTMPYYFARQDYAGDPYMTYIVTGADVPVLASAADDAEVISTLSWQAVTALENEDPAPELELWTRVQWDGPEAGDAIEGYISNEQLRSLIDYRLIASSRNGRWRITAFLAGD